MSDRVSTLRVFVDGTLNVPVRLRTGEDGYIIAECPVIPGCVTQGRTPADAMANVREAIKLCLDNRCEEA